MIHNNPMFRKLFINTTCYVLHSITIILLGSCNLSNPYYNNKSEVYKLYNSVITDPLQKGSKIEVLRLIDSIFNAHNDGR